MDLVISVLSVVIALAVLFVAYWQGHLTRKHNRLSVTPKLQTHTSQNDSGNSGAIELTLTNAGVGPGIIKTIQLKKNGASIDELTNELVKAELEYLPLEIKHVRTGWIQPDYFMSEKEPFSLVRIEFESTDPQASAQSLLDKIRQIFDAYAIVGTYESIYGDTFDLDTVKQNGGTGSVPS